MTAQATPEPATADVAPDPQDLAPFVARFGGRAATFRGSDYLSHVGDTTDTTAVVDWWEPPHDMALSAAICDELLDLANEIEPTPGPNGVHYHLTDLAMMSEGLVETLRMRLWTANVMWWRLDCDKVSFSLKHYRPGERHGEHMDWIPGHSSSRKLVAGAQLSDGGDYEGGDLIVWFGRHELHIPRARGTFFALPGWVHHEVLEVTAGERWSLVANGWGPMFR